MKEENEKRNGKRRKGVGLNLGKGKGTKRRKWDERGREKNESKEKGG